MSGRGFASRMAVLTADFVAGPTAHAILAGDENALPADLPANRRAALVA